MATFAITASIWYLGCAGILTALANPLSSGRSNYLAYPESEENELLEDPCSRHHQCNSSIEALCRCDQTCSIYGDCCPNAPNTNHGGISSQRNVLECSTEGFFFISKCPSDFPRNSLTKRKCENPGGYRGPYFKIPVVDTRAKLTFRNYYCAQCHGVDETSALFWNIRFSCDSILPYSNAQNEIDLARQLIFYEELDSWGVWVATNLTNRSFHRCEARMTFPNISSFRYEPRPCISDMVDTCPRSWLDRETARKCSSQHALIFGADKRRYKNVYCALCNGAYAERDMFCFQVQPRTAAASPSFSILLDMNGPSGGTASGASECPRGHVKFGDKCKRLTCGIPDHILYNGRCIRRRRV